MATNGSQDHVAGTSGLRPKADIRASTQEKGPATITGPVSRGCGLYPGPTCSRRPPRLGVIRRTKRRWKAAAGACPLAYHKLLKVAQDRPKQHTIVKFGTIRRRHILDRAFGISHSHRNPIGETCLGKHSIKALGGSLEGIASQLNILLLDQVQLRLKLAASLFGTVVKRREGLRVPYPAGRQKFRNF